ncbi:MAG: DUF502 domain-containing protein [Firmicutes bacterium]|nr:DUF502 domain-containing protein [Bacillota bacterium]
MRKVQTFFVTGLIVFIPLAFTVVFLRFVFNLIDGILHDPVRAVLGRDVPGLGAAASLIIILGLGALAANILGKRLIALGEYAISRTPLAGSIYVTVKQIVDTFLHADRSPFRRVCLIEWPRREIYCIAFVTGETPQSCSGRTGGLLSVYIPTTPNPTSGFLVLVPGEDVQILDISVEEGIKMVVSGGILTPEQARNMAGGQPVGGNG